MNVVESGQMFCYVLLYIQNLELNITLKQDGRQNMPVFNTFNLSKIMYFALEKRQTPNVKPLLINSLLYFISNVYI